MAYIYGAELFPTKLRGMAIGLGSIFGRVGGILAPLLILLESKNKDNKTKMGVILKSLPSVIFSICAILAALLTALLPETKDKPLLQTVAQADQFYAKNERRFSKWKNRSTSK